MKKNAFSVREFRENLGAACRLRTNSSRHFPSLYAAAKLSQKFMFYFWLRAMLGKPRISHDPNWVKIRSRFTRCLRDYQMTFITSRASSAFSLIKIPRAAENDARDNNKEFRTIADPTRCPKKFVIYKNHQPMAVAWASLDIVNTYMIGARLFTRRQFAASCFTGDPDLEPRAESPRIWFSTFLRAQLELVIIRINESSEWAWAAVKSSRNCRFGVSENLDFVCATFNPKSHKAMHIRRANLSPTYLEQADLL